MGPGTAPSWGTADTATMHMVGGREGAAPSSQDKVQGLCSTCMVGCRPAVTHLWLLEWGEGAKGGRIRWAQRCWGKLLLALLDLPIDSVPVQLTGCATALSENHSSSVSLKGPRGHLECPWASLCYRGHQAPSRASSLGAFPASGADPSVSAPSTSHQHPFGGPRMLKGTRAVSNTHLEL